MAKKTKGKQKEDKSAASAHLSPPVAESSNAVPVTTSKWTLECLLPYPNLVILQQRFQSTKNLNLNRPGVQVSRDGAPRQNLIMVETHGASGTMQMMSGRMPTVFLNDPMD